MFGDRLSRPIRDQAITRVCKEPADLGQHSPTRGTVNTGGLAQLVTFVTLMTFAPQDLNVGPTDKNRGCADG